MEASLRRLVRERAGRRCEYCRVHQDEEPYFQFHVEHVISSQHRGSDDLENLALACRHCNLHKGPNIAGIDPKSNAITPLFNPRRDEWSAHFALAAGAIQGLTAIGRTTVEVLAMNDEDRTELRNAIDSEQHF